jgi:hypothetical protein
MLERFRVSLRLTDEQGTEIKVLSRTSQTFVFPYDFDDCCDWEDCGIERPECSEAEWPEEHFRFELEGLVYEKQPLHPDHPDNAYNFDITGTMEDDGVWCTELDYYTGVTLSEDHEDVEELLALPVREAERIFIELRGIPRK